MNPLEIESLLADDDWIRRFTYALVREPATADDIVQEAWVAALSRQDMRHDRPYLAGVIRNLWRQLRRGEGRRAEREKVAAKTESIPSFEEEILLRREVADGLLELPESQRRILYRRYFQDAPLKTIAREEGISISTAHARLGKALEAMREELDSRHGGDRTAWAIGLLPLAQAAQVSAAATVGVTMTTGMKLAIPVLLIGSAVGIWQFTEADELQPRGVEAGHAGGEEVGNAPPLLKDETVGSESARVADSTPRSVLPVEPDAPATLMQGVVVDTLGRPMVAAGVRFTETETARDHVAQTDLAGAFSLQVAPGAPGAFELRDPELAIIVSSRDQDGVRLVGGRAFRYAGIVVDENGAGLEDVEVAARVANTVYRETGLLRPWIGGDDPWLVHTDAEGRFELNDVVGGEATRLEASLDGYARSTSTALPEHDDTGLVITLARPEQTLEIVGTVIDPAGAPLEGARVSVGTDIVTTDAAGAFRLPWDPDLSSEATYAKGTDGVWRAKENHTHLAATHADFGPVRLAMSAELAQSPIVLQLPEDSLTITGTVVDKAGEPLPSVVVWIQDPTPFGQMVRSQGAGTARWNTNVERQLSGERGVQTDSRGRFEVRGLFARAYRVQVYDTLSASPGRGWDIEAGTRNIELVLEHDSTAQRVAGRVLSIAGEPLSGIEIEAGRTGLWASYEEAPPQTGAALVTDAAGHFEFPRLATLNTTLTLNGDGLFMHNVALAGHEDLEALELRVARLCELQVDLGGDRTRADEIGVLDTNGRTLRLLESFGAFMSQAERADVTEGKTSVIRVPESARTLILYLESVEVQRVALELDPLERTTVRP